VLAALRELLRGFEHADRVANGAIMGEVRRENLQEVYVGIVTVLMRMVFVLFAEERSLLPMEHDLYAGSYSLTRLYAQLVEDRGRFGDGLDERYGAWARVITLFRLLHDGVRAADGLTLPARKGALFNPDTFPCLNDGYDTTRPLEGALLFLVAAGFFSRDDLAETLVRAGYELPEGMPPRCHRVAEVIGNFRTAAD
jgi:hypothetical protein